MKILPNITNIKCSRLTELEDSYTIINFNESSEIALSYKETDKSNFDILSDLLECRAYATALLYLNENYILSDKYSGLLKNREIKDFYEDCEELLSKNIKIVEEVGIPLIDINGYKIFEGQGYILRGNGKKKIRESFSDIELNDEIKEAIKQFIVDSFTSEKYKNYGFDLRKPYTNDAWMSSIYKNVEEGIPSQEILSKMKDYYEEIFDDVVKENDLKECTINEDGEGTQTTDIAPKLDQDLGINKPKKKYKDVLISDINENEGILNKGFMKNIDGFYQRGNYILVKEGDKYLAVHKNKLNELDATQAFNNISTIQKTIQEETGCTVSVEIDGNKAIIRIKGNGTQLNDAMKYGDELKELLKSWGNTVDFSTSTNEFIYTAY